MEGKQKTTRWILVIAALLLLACFALRFFNEESAAKKNWVVPESSRSVEVVNQSIDRIESIEAVENAPVENAPVENAPVENAPVESEAIAENTSVEFAYPRTPEESFVELASKQTEVPQSPGNLSAIPEDTATEWAPVVATNVQPDPIGSVTPLETQEPIFEQLEPRPSIFPNGNFSPAPVDSVSSDVKPFHLPFPLTGNDVAVATNQPEPSFEPAATLETGLADSADLADSAPSVFEPVSAPELGGFHAPESLPATSSELQELPETQQLQELRVAAVPQVEDKPKFRKFGATTKSKKDDEDDEDDEDPPEKQPVALSSSTKWKLAATPRKGDRYKEDIPLTDNYSHFIDDAQGNFSPTPTMSELPYDPLAQMNVYQGKQLNANQRPLIELGRPWYQLGPISEGSSILGFHNNVNPQYLLFGDARSGFASNNVGGDGNTLVASQLNFFHHLKFTSTERFVAGHTPLSRGANNTRYNFDDSEFEFEGNANFNFAYFEGDVGAITGGAIGKTLPFDLPFAAGIIPLVFQNGIWMEDEILGFAVTIPARNSARLDISNMDITFFAGYDRLNSPAFLGDDSAARVMGVATFIDAMNGHFEIDYAFLDDRTNLDRSYHNIGFGFTRRYGRFLSNSTRVIVNAGQQNGVPGTADGVLLLSENSLITSFPSTVVPYLNMFAGFDRPQSVGRNAAAGGILRNTGILFESDNLTGYPTLDATANDTFGMALGLNLLADEFAQQLIVEASMLGVMGDGVGRNALGDQYGLGVRYQLPLTNSVLVRADAMVGFLRGDEDINGARLELRKKF